MLQVPIVVVGNKRDGPVDPALPLESLEATVVFDWENGYCESSAKDKTNINKIILNEFIPNKVNTSQAIPNKVISSILKPITLFCEFY